MFPSRPSKSTTMALAHDAIANASVLAQLLHIISEGDTNTRWRAAWVIEKVAQQQPSLLIGERNHFMRLAIHADTPYGLRRLLLTTLLHLPDTDELDIAFFNFLLDQMLDLQAPPGVQATAMKLAERLSRTDPVLHDEFLLIVRNMELDYYPPALRSVARRYVQKR